MIKQKNNFKIFISNDVFAEREIYIGLSVKRRRIIIFKRDKGEHINIDNLIFPSVIENNYLIIPKSVCKYLEWDFTDSLKIYQKSDCVIIEPSKKTPRGVF